ncbi:MAG: PEP-CTERM sorting domain-containing protein [Akkermansiaceae bacterium]
MKTPSSLITKILATGISLSMLTVASAVNILISDFSSTTKSGTTLSGISWTTEGITAPANSLTATNTTLNTGDGDLWTTADAAGYFAPNNNTGSGGVWNTQVDFTTLGDSIDLTNFELDWINFNNSGINQPSARDNTFTLKILDLDNANAELFSNSIKTAAVNTVASGVQTTTFDLSSISLLSGNNYRLFIEASEADVAGSHSSIGAITLNGTVVPEPTSLALLFMSGSLLLVRRRP